MPNIYLGFNAHGSPIRISRELACKMYKCETGLNDKAVAEIMDKSPAMFADEDDNIFLAVCDDTIKDEEAFVHIGNIPVRATELPV